LTQKVPKLADMMMDRARMRWPTCLPKRSQAADRLNQPAERMNEEVQRRADVIGIVPNDAAVIRLAGALMLEQNDELRVSRRYMTLETTGSVSHKPIVGLPALAACTRTRSCRGSTVPTPPRRTRP